MISKDSKMYLRHIDRLCRLWKCACFITIACLFTSKIVTCKKRAKKARNRRASRVFLFAVGFVNEPKSPSESRGVRRLLRNNRRVRGRPLNPYVARAPSRFPKGRERAMKSTRTTTAIVWQRRHLVPRVTFVKGLLGFSPRSLSLSLSLSLPCRSTFSALFPARHMAEGFLTTLDERRLIARLLLPVNCSRSTLLN